MCAPNVSVRLTPQGAMPYQQLNASALIRNYINESSTQRVR